MHENYIIRILYFSFINNNFKYIFNILINRCVDMITILLEHGADIDILDDGGKNSLHLSIKIGSQDIFNTLLDHNYYVSVNNRIYKIQYNIIS